MKTIRNICFNLGVALFWLFVVVYMGLALVGGGYILWQAYLEGNIPILLGGGAVLTGIIISALMAPKIFCDLE